MPGVCIPVLGNAEGGVLTYIGNFSFRGAWITDRFVHKRVCKGMWPMGIAGRRYSYGKSQAIPRLLQHENTSKPSCRRKAIQCVCLAKGVVKLWHPPPLSALCPTTNHRTELNLAVTWCVMDSAFCVQQMSKCRLLCRIISSKSEVTLASSSSLNSHLSHFPLENDLSS